MDDDVRTQRADWEIEDQAYLDSLRAEQFGDVRAIYREQYRRPLPVERTRPIAKVFPREAA